MKKSVRLCNYRDLHLTDDERAEARAAAEQVPESERDATYRHLLTSRLIELTIRQSTIPLDPAEVHERAKAMARSLEKRLQADGLDIEGYCKALNTTEEGIVADFEPAARRQMQERAVLLAIAEEEGLTATQKEYSDEVQRLADRYMAPVEDLVGFFAGGEGDSIREDITVSKAAAFMATLAQVQSS